MIARAAHTVNAGLVPERTPLGSVDGVNLDDTVDRIAGWGGDAALYAHFLGQGLAHSQASASGARALGVLAGWRSGVVDLRDEALLRVADVAGEAAEAALGLPAGQLQAFTSAQATDPFAWPTSDQLVARIGGFSGFGDAWIEPPSSARFISAHALEVTCGDELWLVYVDVFGARLARAQKTASALWTTPTAGSLISENSYLVEIARISW